MGRKFGSGKFELTINLKQKDGEINKNIKIEPPENGFYQIKFERAKK